MRRLVLLLLTNVFEGLPGNMLACEQLPGVTTCVSDADLQIAISSIGNGPRPLLHTGASIAVARG